MKNKEIEELLEEIKNVDNYSNFIASQHGGNDYYYLLEIQEAKLLLSYIEQLEKKVDQYENPEDLTLFYMWLDTKAKDKMKQLENNRDKAIKYLKQPYRDNFDYSKAELINILESDEQ